MASAGGASSDRPDVYKLLSREEKTRIRIRQLVLLFLGALLTGIGASYIGRSLIQLGSAIEYNFLDFWPRYQLESAIIVTIVGAILLAISLNSMASPVLTTRYRLKTA